jgi:alkylation response protein AidB-like acyl-CoA dehydrogenase
MRLPGIEIRPIRQITGFAEFNEVFLNEVVIEDAARLGDVDNGWRVASSTMLSERAGLGSQPVGVGNIAGSLLDRLLGDPDVEPVVIDRAMELRLRELALDLTMARAAFEMRNGRPGPEGAIGKVCRSELAQAVSELALGAAGLAGVDWQPRDVGTAASALLAARAATVAGGTSEMQRNVIGEKVLGLPKDPGIDPRLPWRQLRRS